jgi:transcriptional regulator with XRE-family HTH domain
MSLNRKELGEKLGLLRKNNKKVTQKEVAKALNMGKSTYIGYEKGRNTPGLITLMKLANYYEVSIDWLLGRTHDNNLKGIVKSKCDRKALHAINQIEETNTEGKETIDIFNQKQFCNKLKALRNYERKITQKQLSENTDISIRVISEHENGNAIPSLITLIKLANYYDVSIDWLLGRVQLES